MTILTAVVFGSLKRCANTTRPLKHTSFSLFLPRSIISRRGFFTLSRLCRPSLRGVILGIYRCSSSNETEKLKPRESRTQRWQDSESKKKENRNYALYFTSGFFLFIGVAYASAPLYKAFCQATNLGGELNIHLRDEKAEKLAYIDPVKEYGEITVRFHSAKDARMLWDFRPQQETVRVYPGETALAFFTATNPTERAIVGVSTYNIIPYEAAPYFNKIQCFCFDDQRLEPHESVDMPVFFYIDPDIVTDYRCRNVKEIALGYTFFESKGGLEVPPANSPTVAKNFEKQY